MQLEDIRKTLVDSEQPLAVLRAKIDSEDCNDSTRSEFKNLIDRRVEAFVRLLNDFPTEQYLEVCAAMRAARGEA